MARILARLFAGLALASSISAQPKAFTVTFRIDGLAPGEVIVVIDGDHGSEDARKVTIQVGGGRFLVSATADGFRHGRADFGAGGDIEFFVFPGAEVAVDGAIESTMVSAYPSGDRANDDLAILNRQLDPPRREVSAFEARATRQTNAARAKAIRQLAEPAAAEMQRIRTAFLHAHPDSPVAAWLLADMLAHGDIRGDDAVREFGKLRQTPEASGPYSAMVARRVAGIAHTRVGATVPDVRSAKTYDGSPFDLGALRGRYVVIDFWGTWCGPCMEEIPRMKLYRARHAEKVQFVSIAQGSPDANWRATIAKAPLDWPQLQNGAGDEDFVLTFNVTAYPTKLLIDPAGKIIGRYVGNGDAFYKKLDSLFGR